MQIVIRFAWDCLSGLAGITSLGLNILC